MIFNGLADVVFWLFSLIFDGFSIVALPLNTITAVINIMKYGIWIMGVDLFVITWSCIIFWLTFKFSAGLVLFIWRLLPLT